MRRVGEIAAAIGLALLVAVGVYIGIPIHPPDPGPALPSGIVAFADASSKSSPPSFQIPPLPSRPAASAPATVDPPAVGTAIMSVRMTRPQSTGRRGEWHVAAAHSAATVAVQPRLSTATPLPITSAADQHPVALGHRSTHHTAADHASAGHHYAYGHHHNGVAPAASGRSSASRHRHRAKP
jgi:hypothetical protein